MVLIRPGRCPAIRGLGWPTAALNTPIRLLVAGRSEVVGVLRVDSTHRRDHRGVPVDVEPEEAVVADDRDGGEACSCSTPVEGLHDFDAYRVFGVVGERDRRIKHRVV